LGGLGRKLVEKAVSDILFLTYYVIEKINGKNLFSVKEIKNDFLIIKE
jgi:hypothetical protein